MKTKSLTQQQSALFKVQLWHLRRQKHHEKLAREFAYVKWARYHKRRANQHRKFVNAITPFVLPL
jgi:plasmid replication initiation protein